MSNVRRQHTKADTPSAPPIKKVPRTNDGAQFMEDNDESEEMGLSIPKGPANRRFQTIKLRSIPFAVPEGYDTQNVKYLGGGAYGNVMQTSAKCQDGTVRKLAIKKLRDPFYDPAQARRIYREIKLLQLMKHDNIISALDLYTPDDKDSIKDVYVVTEYAGRSLFTILAQQTSKNIKIVNADHTKFIIYQIARALKYIHSGNIIHRDLKPGNLALTDDSDLTVLDFGLARSLENKDTLTQYVQTRWYRSPEVIYWKIDSYTNQADMWSLGCIAAELLTGTPLFPGKNVNELYMFITELCGSPDEELMQKIAKDNSPSMRLVIQSFPHFERKNLKEYFKDYEPTDEFIDLLEKLLVLDPEKRLNVDEAISHPYLKEYSLPEDEPTAEQVFDLDDEGSRTASQWKEIIWNEIVNFQRISTSPIIPS